MYLPTEGHDPLRVSGALVESPRAALQKARSIAICETLLEGDRMGAASALLPANGDQ